MGLKENSQSWERRFSAVNKKTPTREGDESGPGFDKKFIKNAKPEIIANETNKKQDAELKITLIEAALAAL